MNQLITDEVFQPILKYIQNFKVAYLPMDGNVGDELIEQATFELLERHNIDYRAINTEELISGKLEQHANVILVSGGGNMGDYYTPPIRDRQRAVEFKLPIIVLPQTFINTKEELGNYQTIYVRDNTSLSMVPNSILMPDMALNFKFKKPSEPSNSQGIFLRVDSEACFTDNELSLGDPTVLHETLSDYLALAASFEHIITDRLHFAVAALGQGRRTTLLPNSYFKNRAMYDTWLKDLGCEWADSPNQFIAMANPSTHRQ